MNSCKNMEFKFHVIGIDSHVQQDLMSLEYIIYNASGYLASTR